MQFTTSAPALKGLDQLHGIRLIKMSFDGYQSLRFFKRCRRSRTKSRQPYLISLNCQSYITRLGNSSDADADADHQLCFAAQVES